MTGEFLLALDAVADVTHYAREHPLALEGVLLEGDRQRNLVTVFVFGRQFDVVPVEAALAGVEVVRDGTEVVGAEPLGHDHGELLADQFLGLVAEHPLD